MAIGLVVLGTGSLSNDGFRCSEMTKPRRQPEMLASLRQRQHRRGVQILSEAVIGGRRVTAPTVSAVQAPPANLGCWNDRSTLKAAAALTLRQTAELGPPGAFASGRAPMDSKTPVRQGISKAHYT